MTKLNAGKASVFALVATFVVSAFLFLNSFTGASAVACPPTSNNPACQSPSASPTATALAIVTATATATASPTTVKVDVCHQDGQSGNYSHINVSVSSVNDATGLNGHGDHEGDVWAPFIFNDVSYPGQGDYQNFDFEDCDHEGGQPTSTPTGTPSPTIDPCIERQCPTPTPDPDVCANIEGVQLNVPGDLHLDASGKNCVAYEFGGPQPGGNGQVLGASTMAETGGFAENLYLAIMTLGGLFTSKGLKNFKKAFKKA